MNNISALKNLYASLGGSLTDSYADIADGSPVGDYSQIADGISAVAKKATGEKFARFTGSTEATSMSSNWAHCSINEDYADIISAIESEKHVEIVIEHGAGSSYIFRVCEYNSSSGAFVISSMEGDSTLSTGYIFSAAIRENDIDDFTVKVYKIT